MSIELINAARLGQLDTINSLIAEGVNLDSLYAENTALMAASYNNQEAIVESLIKHGVNINTPNNYQQTALIFASAAGNKNIVKLLVQHGANLEANDSRGSTALMMAVIKNSDESIAKILLDAGADINARDGAGDTVLMYAIRGNNIAAARYILRY